MCTVLVFQLLPVRVINCALALRRYATLVMAAGSSPGTTERTNALLEVWGTASVQSQLDRIVLNRVMYERVATALAGLGYEYSWQ